MKYQLAIGIALALIGAVFAWLMSVFPNPITPQANLRWGIYTHQSENAGSSSDLNYKLTTLLVENTGRAAAKNIIIRISEPEVEIAIAEDFLPNLKVTQFGQEATIGFLPTDTIATVQIYSDSAEVVRSVSHSGEPVVKRELVGISFKPITAEEIGKKYSWLIILALMLVGIVAAIKSAPKKE